MVVYILSIPRKSAMPSSGERLPHRGLLTKAREQIGYLEG